jgi:hypothetical protein
MGGFGFISDGGLGLGNDLPVFAGDKAPALTIAVRGLPEMLRAF